MREIKFRAWNGRSMEYGGFSVHATGKVIPDSELTNVGEGAPVMQYTGLKDQDKTGIYEGDIVLKPTGTCKQISREINQDGCEVTQYVANPPVKAVVSNRGYAFFLGTKEDNEYFGVLGYGRDRMGYDLEVIGNIYENPELVEKDNE